MTTRRRKGQMHCCGCCVPSIDRGHFPPRVARPLAAGAWLCEAAGGGQSGGYLQTHPLLTTLGPIWPGLEEDQGGLEMETQVDKAAEGKIRKRNPSFSGRGFWSSDELLVLSESGCLVGDLSLGAGRAFIHRKWLFLRASPRPPASSVAQAPAVQ